MTAFLIPVSFRTPGFRRRLLIACSLGCVLTLVAWWKFYPAEVYPYALEFSIESFTPASAQVYFDRGEGLRETNSTRQPLTIGSTKVRLPLPPGRFRELRFDPLDRYGNATISRLHITDPHGKIVRELSWDQLTPNDQIENVVASGATLHLTPKAGATDPQFSIRFSPELELKFGRFARFTAASSWLIRVFAACVATLLLTEKVWRQSQHGKSFVQFSRGRPRLALALCVGFAAMLSSYPVIFFGKSYVSPNTTMLLYPGKLSIPGYADTQREDARGADVGAFLWQHLPYTAQENRALRAGTLPLWNRFSSCGVTLLGQGQSMFGDPLHLLVVATNAASWAFDIKYILAKALFGCGLAWCVWSLTRDFAASAILGFGSVFIAFFNYRINHPSIFTMGYAPWVLVSWFQLTAATDQRAFRNSLVLWFAANWLLLTSGTVKEAYMLGLLLNLTGALIFFTDSRRKRQLLRQSFIILLATIGFIAVTCPLWWSFLESLRTAYTSYDTPGISQVPGQWFIGLFDDLFYREFHPRKSVYKPAANFLILLGCLWAVLQPRRLARSKPILLITLAAAFSVMLAFRFGPLTWFSSWILAVPFLRNIYNLDTVFSCTAIVFLCILAGWGFSVAREPLGAGQSGKFGTAMAIIVGALFSVYFCIPSSRLGAGHTWAGWSNLTESQALVYSHVFALPLAAWVLVVVAQRHLRGTRFGWRVFMVGSLAIVVLLGRHGQHLRYLPTTFLAAPGPRADLQAPSASVQFFQRNARAQPARVVGLAENLFPGFATIYGLEVINGANALENRAYREFAEAAGLVTPGEWSFVMPAENLQQWRPIADFLNVRYLASPENLAFPSNGYREVTSLDFKIFESEHVWPRAFFTNKVEHYDTPGDLVRMIQDPSSKGPFAAIPKNPEKNLVLPTVERGSADASSIPADNYHFETNTTAFTIHAPCAGIAVLQEAWLPNDFQATLNGEPVPYFRVNHAFKGVVIPRAGTYRLEFAYWPHGFSASLMIGALGLFVIAASLFATRWLSQKSSYLSRPVAAG